MKKQVEPTAPAPLYPGPNNTDVAMIASLCEAHNAQVAASPNWRADAWRQVTPELLLKVWHHGAETWHGVNGHKKVSDRHNRSLHCLDRMRAFLVMLKYGVNYHGPSAHGDYDLLPAQHPLHNKKEVSLLDLQIKSRENNKRITAIKDELFDELWGKYNCQQYLDADPKKSRDQIMESFVVPTEFTRLFEARLAQLENN